MYGGVSSEGLQVTFYQEPKIWKEIWQKKIFLHEFQLTRKIDLEF